MIKNYFKFLKENLIIEQYSDKDQNKLFYISEEFKRALFEIEQSTIRSILIDLKFGTLRKNIVDDPIDYLDCDAEGNVSFLKSKYFVSDINGFKNPRRMKMKITKILPLIYNEEYLKSNIKQSDIEQFINSWNAHFKGMSSIEIQELRGDDILRAYNYTGELSKNFGSSCANFGQESNDFGEFEEPLIESYDIYTKNPENMGVVVAIKDNIIMGRRLFHQGIQLENDNDYIEGNFYTIWNNYYGIGSADSIYDRMIKKYLEKKYDARPKYGIHGGNPRSGRFLIHLETRFVEYCAFDGMHVCFEKNLITDKIKRDGTQHLWVGTYGARCPKRLVEERLNGIKR